MSRNFNADQSALPTTRTENLTGRSAATEDTLTTMFTGDAAGIGDRSPIPMCARQRGNSNRVTRDVYVADRQQPMPAILSGCL